MPCSEQGELLTDQLDELVRPNTKAMILLHASNVCGTFNATGSGECILPKAQVAFLLDSAQTAGVFPIDMKALGLDALAFTVHKSLLGL